MTYKLALFDMDDTLLSGRTIYAIADRKGFRKEVDKIINQRIPSYKKTIRIAKLLKGMTLKEFMDIFRSIPLNPSVEETINALREKGLKTAIVTNSYDVAAEDLRKRLKMDYVVGNHLIIDRGIITGEIELHNKNPVDDINDCLSRSVCKRDALYELCNKLGISTREAIAVGDGGVDIPMIEVAGLGVAYRAPPHVNERADVVITDMKELLRYL
jgi:phosphoserine phosphatase